MISMTVMGMITIRLLSIVQGALQNVYVNSPRYNSNNRKPNNLVLLLVLVLVLFREETCNEGLLQTTSDNAVVE